MVYFQLAVLNNLFSPPTSDFPMQDQMGSVVCHKEGRAGQSESRTQRQIQASRSKGTIIVSFFFAIHIIAAFLNYLSKIC